MSKVEDVLEVIKGMTLIELRDLNKAIEEEFGVTAAAPVAMAAAPAAGGDAGGAAADELGRTVLPFERTKAVSGSGPHCRRD